MENGTNRSVTRRRVLAGATVGVVGLAGCSGSGDTGDPEPTSTPTATPTPEASFELRTLTSDDVVRAGGTLTASATVANVGDADGTASVAFGFADQRRVGTVDLAAGEARPATVDVDLTQLDPDRYELTAEGAEGADGHLSRPVDVFPADPRPGLHGAVVSEAGASLAGNSIGVTALTDGSPAFGHAQIGDAERFGLSHPTEPPYDAIVAFTKRHPGVHDGVPAIVGLESKSRVTSDSELLGRYAIPEAYRTEVRFVDANGDPVADFSAVNFYTKSGSGMGPRSFSTDADGYVTAAGASETGISVPAEGEGALVASARPRDGSRPVRFGTVYGSAAGEEFTFQVDEPDRFASP
ncbi:MAG: hypothetical protein ABEJ23_04950 [Haloarculaceae archaeon]